METHEALPYADDGLSAVFEARLFLEIPGKPALTVKFEDLCTPCTKAVKTHFDAIAKKIDGLSPERAPRKQVKPEVSIIDGAALKPATVTHVKKAKDA